MISLRKMEKNFLKKGQKIELTYNIRNTNRTVGAKISSFITRKYGMHKLSEGHVSIKLRGSAGNSLGAFAVQGLKINVFGDSNDYVVRDYQVEQLSYNQEIHLTNQVMRM